MQRWLRQIKRRYLLLVGIMADIASVNRLEVVSTGHMYMNIAYNF